MSEIATSNPPLQSSPFVDVKSGLAFRRSVINGAVALFSSIATLFAIATFLYIVGYVITQGGKYISLDFFTQTPPPPGQTGGGMGNAIVGSLILIVLASIVGIPLGLFNGIYLAEFGKNSLFATFVRYVIDILVGIPTIIFGLFAWVIIVVPQHGFSATAGGVALGIIMIPIVTRTTEEVLRLVPVELREAALALGIPEWRMLLQVIIPSVRSGLITGMLLSITRVAGETAPLLMTAFGFLFWNTDITQPIDALPLRIYFDAKAPYPVEVQQAYTGALVLITVITLTSFAVRWATGAFSRPTR